MSAPRQKPISPDELEPAGPTAERQPRVYPHPAAQHRQVWINFNLRRSLQLHRPLAIGLFALAMAIALGYAVRSWKIYAAQSLVYIQPDPGRLMDDGSASRWPSSADSYKAYVQHKIHQVTSPDVLIAALGKLPGGSWRHSDESERSAADRLGRAVVVAQVSNSYQVSISAKASTPGLAAQIANVVAASFIEIANRELRASDAQRYELLRTDPDRLIKELAIDRAELDEINRQLGVAATGKTTSDPGGAPIGSVRVEPGKASTSSAAPSLQHLNELASDIARLQARSTTVEKQFRDLASEHTAPRGVYLLSAAVPPLHAARTTLLRNFAVLVLIGIFASLGVPLVIHHLDPRIAIGEDVERVLGCAPIALLPDFDEVSSEVSEEYILRLAAAIDHSHQQGILKNCILTGVSPRAGVTTVATRVRGMLEAMGRGTVLIDAAGAGPAASNLAAPGQANPSPAPRAARSTALLQQMAEEADKDVMVFTDTAPLLVSGETEYLARFADSAMVVIESGVTTRAQLQEIANTLRRLEVSVVRYVLNRIALDRADPSFRQSVKAIEEYRSASSSAGSRGDLQTSPPPVSAGTAEEPGVLSPLRPTTPDPSEKKLLLPTDPYPAVKARGLIRAAVLTSLPEPAAQPSVPAQSSSVSRTPGRMDQPAIPPSDWTELARASRVIQPLTPRPLPSGERKRMPSRVAGALAAQPQLSAFETPAEVVPQPPMPAPAPELQVLQDESDIAAEWPLTDSDLAPSPAEQIGKREVPMPDSAYPSAGMPQMDDEAFNSASRLGGLRTLLVSLGLRNLNKDVELRPLGQHPGKNQDHRLESEAEAGYEPCAKLAVYAHPHTSNIAGNGELPVPESISVTTMPEFFPPHGVLQPEAYNEPVSTLQPVQRLDTVTKNDELETLPSWRGQYRKR